MNQIKKKIKFNWETPIHIDILEFSRHMAESMEQVASRPRESGWFANNRLQEDAHRMADAYRTIEKHILNEIRMRKLLK